MTTVSFESFFQNHRQWNQKDLDAILKLFVLVHFCIKQICTSFTFIVSGYARYWQKKPCVALTWVGNVRNKISTRWKMKINCWYGYLSAHILFKSEKEITPIWCSNKYSWVLITKEIFLIWFILLVQPRLPQGSNLVLPDPSGCLITLLTRQQDSRVKEPFCFRKFCQLFNLRFHLFNDFLIWPFNVLPYSSVFLPFYLL